MKNKKLIIAAVALLAVVAIMIGISSVAKPQGVAGGKSVQIVIVYEDGTTREETYQTDAEFLSELLLEKELVTGYESQEYGFTIESVDGITLDWSKDGAYWALYVGEEYAITSAAGIVLEDGGVYKLVYEKL